MRELVKKVQLDEIELYLQLLIAEMGDSNVSMLSYAEIANIIQDKHKVECTERDVFLLYEPSLDDSIYDLQLQYEIFNNKWW